jgi:hypothetical protein
LPHFLADPIHPLHTKKKEASNNEEFITKTFEDSNIEKSTTKTFEDSKYVTNLIFSLAMSPSNIGRVAREIVKHVGHVAIENWGCRQRNF